MTPALQPQHTLLSLCTDLYWCQDAHGRCHQVASFSASPDAVAQQLRQHSFDQLIALEDREAWLSQLQGGNTFRRWQCRVNTPEGHRYLQVAATPVMDQRGRFSHYECMAVDITSVRSHDADLERFRAAMDMSLDMIFLVDRETLTFIDANDTACLSLEVSRDELILQSPGKVMGFSEAELTERYDRLIKQGVSSRIERRLRRSDSSEAIIEIYSRATEIQGRWVIIGVGRDITARKQAENRALRLQRIFSALSLTNEAILRAENRQDLFEDVCAAAVSSGLFTTASILAPLKSGRFKAIANAGNYTRQPEKVLVTTTPDIPEGRGLTSEAYRSGKAQSSNDFKNDPRTSPWHDLARQFDIGSAAAYPLFERKQCIAVMLFYAGPVDTFDAQNQSILQSMADNISFALDSFAADEEQQRAAEAIRRNEQRFRSLTSLTSDFYWEMDAGLHFIQYEGRIIGESNQKAVRTLIGRHLWNMPGVRADTMNWRKFRRLLRQEKAFRDFEYSFTNSEGVVYYLSLAGEPIFDDQHRFCGYRGISRDISDKKRADNRIRHLATHDTLTGLPNRVMFTELLRNATRTASRYKDNAFAVLFIDLDRFKTVNDTYGHHAGDRLLVEVAKRLRLPLRSSDIVARLGGDEFVVLLHKVSARGLALTTANHILETFSQPVKVDDREFMVGCSIGVSLFGIDAFNEEELMNHADTAMYAAKEDGRNNVHCYSAELHQHTQRRAGLSLQLRQALQHDQLSLNYQAKLDMNTGQAVGVEALLRWHHPELGDVSPSQFIPIAEDNGLIIPIGEWAITQAIKQLHEWDTLNLPPLNLAVNLSARQFNYPELGKFIINALRAASIDPQRLELEITESLMIQNPEHAIAVIKAIKDTGVRFALDDFGTGYSSLGQLRHYPIDTLKIDRAFVRDLAISREDQAISKAIISMGKTLGMAVVAEGVETPEQLALLSRYQCDQIQGFFYHRPVPSDEFVSWYLKQTQIL